MSLGAYFLAVTLKPLANASQYACVYEYQVEVGERERIKSSYTVLHRQPYRLTPLCVQPDSTYRSSYTIVYSTYPRTSSAENRKLFLG